MIAIGAIDASGPSDRQWSTVKPNPHLPGFAGDNSPGGSLIRTLRRFGQPRAVQERCELCGIGLPSNHRHLWETAGSRMVCACDPCAFRFQDVVGSRFKLIPKDIWRLPEFSVSDAEWGNLALPINLAFFFRSTLENKVKALYPSPAGATESQLPLAAWNSLAERNPRLETMRSDVEAFLVNRVGTKRDYYIVPIDACFELVGLIRIHWRGLSGGDAVWEQVENFFVRLNSDARPASPPGFGRKPAEDLRPSPDSK